MKSNQQKYEEAVQRAVKKFKQRVRRFMTTGEVRQKICARKDDITLETKIQELSDWSLKFKKEA